MSNGLMSKILDMVSKFHDFWKPPVKQEESKGSNFDSEISALIDDLVQVSIYRKISMDRVKVIELENNVLIIKLIEQIKKYIFELKQNYGIIVMEQVESVDIRNGKVDFNTQFNELIDEFIEIMKYKKNNWKQAENQERSSSEGMIQLIKQIKDSIQYVKYTYGMIKLDNITENTDG